MQIWNLHTNKRQRIKNRAVTQFCLHYPSEKEVCFSNKQAKERYLLWGEVFRDSSLYWVVLPLLFPLYLKDVYRTRAFVKRFESVLRLPQKDRLLYQMQRTPYLLWEEWRKIVRCYRQFQPFYWGEKFRKSKLHFLWIRMYDRRTQKTKTIICTPPNDYMNIWRSKYCLWLWYSESA